MSKPILLLDVELERRWEVDRAPRYFLQPRVASPDTMQRNEAI